MLKYLIDSGPLWAVGLTAFLLILIVTETGFHIGVWRSRQPDFESDAQISSITGANLSLLAFILAFTFNMAAGHSNERNQLLLEDVTAIETAYIRAGLQQSEVGEEIQRELRSYVTQISNVGKVFQNSSGLKVAEGHLAKIWLLVDERIIEDKPLNALDSLLIQSVNQVGTLHRKRVVAGSQKRIPATVWNGLIILLVLSMTGMGYFSGVKGRRSPIASTGLALSFASVIFLISDLDRPQSGRMKLDQTVIHELGERLDAIERVGPE